MLIADISNGVSANLLSWFEPDLSPRPVYEGDQLYLLDGYNDGLGLLNFNGTIEAFGDFNSDQYTDVFMLSTDRKTLSIYLWHHALYSFIEQSSLTETSGTITNVAPGDFNYDGKLDVMVFGHTGPELSQTFLKIYLGDRADLSIDPFFSTTNITGQPLILDYNADLKLDLYSTYDDVRTFWVNEGQTFHMEPQGTSESSPISVPNSNAFVDLNGDCISDLVVTSIKNNVSQFEFWINQDGGFKLDKVFKASVGAGQVTFADFNGDGTMDLLYPQCWPRENCTEANTIRVVFNMQIPVCKHLWTDSSTCRDSTALCKVDNNYNFDSMTSLTSTGGSIVISGDMLGAPNRHLLVNSEFSTLTIRAGDYNLDGYPDILIPFMDNNGNTEIELWQNVPCTVALCGSDATDNGLRTFQVVSDGTDALTNIANATSATFFDFDENGALDIIVLCEETKKVHMVYNNFFNDAYFLKTLGSNGVCNAWCSNGQKFPDPKPYGVNFPGSVWKFTVSDLSGNVRVTQGVQLSQSGYLALQTPYILFGLGRTSNYIEQIFMGVSVKESVWFNMWNGIIPNSQVVAFPYPPDEPTLWTLELFVKTSGLTLWVIVAVVSLLLVNSVVIFYFRWREKQEDKKEKEEQQHLINFDAF